MNKPKNFSDYFALSMTKFFRFVADTFFAKGSRAGKQDLPELSGQELMHHKDLNAIKR